MSGIAASGQLFIDRLDDLGAYLGWYDYGNTKKFEVSESVDTKTRLSTNPDNYGTILDSIAIPKPTELSISTDELDREMLSVLFRGTSENITEAAGTNISETFTAKLGKYAKLTKRNLVSASVVVKHNAGVVAGTWVTAVAKTVGNYILPTVSNGHFYKCTTAGTTGAAQPTWPTDGTTVTDGTVVWTDQGKIIMDLNDDYLVEAQLGMIKIVDSGSGVEGETIKVTFDHSAVSGYRVSGGVQRTVRARVRLRGVNLANGKQIHVYIPQTTLIPGGGVDLMTENFAEFTIKGNPTLIDGESAPYYVDPLE